MLYDRYRALIRDEPLPLALVDLDAVDRNVDALLTHVRGTNKILRLASKSIRCLELLRYITERGGGSIRGVMGYTVREAAFLVEHGFEDILVAYPSVQRCDTELLASLNRQGATVSIVVDAGAHLAALDEAAAAASTKIPVVIEVDLSLRLGGALHLGARRSPLYGVEAVLELAESAARFRHLSLHGVMGYESQIAGATDQNPFAPWLNGPKRLVKRLSKRPIERTRRLLVEALRARGHEITLFNGGGTGSLAWASGEDALTEVTVGSGFLGSHLFDYYKDLRCEPAVFFALQVVRHPGRDLVTCHGGGYVASGETGRDKQPLPYLPHGLALLDLEGAGEVQTPLRLPKGLALRAGDPVLFRPAKAGELAERFNEYLLVRESRIESRAPTYRGMGHCFL